MIRFIRLIFSAKAAVFLLCFMALALVLSIPGANSPSFLKLLMLEKGIVSPPFLILTLLLLLNQLGATIIRIKWFFKKPGAEEEAEEQPPSAPEPGLGYDDEDEWKPPTPPARPPAELASHQGRIDSILPADNARSFLQVLHFRIEDPFQFLDHKDEIKARRGGARAFFTLLLHLGAVVLLLGLLFNIAMYPTQQKSVLEGTAHQLGGPVQTPWQSMLKQFGLSDQNTVNYPPVRVEFKKAQQVHKTHHTMIFPQKLVKRWEQSLQQLFLKPEKLHVASWSFPVLKALSVNLKLGNEQRLVHLTQSRSRSFGPYNISLGGLHMALDGMLQGNSFTLRTGKPHIFPNGAVLKLFGYNPLHGPTGCAYLTYKPKTGKPWIGCVALRRPVQFDKTITFMPTSIKQGAVLNYSNSMSENLIVFGLLIFLLGFIGFWWPQRYSVNIIWRRDKNDVSIEGSGFGVQAKSILEGLKESLHFPIDNLAAPAKRSSPSTPQPPQPPPRSGGPGGGPVGGGPGGGPVGGGPAGSPTRGGGSDLRGYPPGPGAPVQRPGVPAQRPEAPKNPEVPGLLQGGTSVANLQAATQQQAGTTQQPAESRTNLSAAGSRAGHPPAGKERPKGLASLPSQMGLPAAGPVPSTPQQAPRQTSAPTAGTPTPPASPPSGPGKQQHTLGSSANLLSTSPTPPAPGGPSITPQRPGQQTPASPGRPGPQRAAGQGQATPPRPTSPGLEGKTIPTPQPPAGTLTQDRLQAPGQASGQPSPQKSPKTSTGTSGAGAASTPETAQMTIQTKSRWRQTDSFDKNAILSAAQQQKAAAQPQPGPGQPGPGQPSASQPGVSQPSASQPGPGQPPSAGRPGPQIPGRPVSPQSSPQPAAPTPPPRPNAPAAPSRPSMSAVPSRPSMSAAPSASQTRPKTQPPASRPAAPKSTAKSGSGDAGLDLDSLFAGISNDKPGANKQDALFDNLDIDSLFDKVESNEPSGLPRSRPDDDEKTAVTQRPPMSDPKK